MKVDVLSGKATLIPVDVFKKIGNYYRWLPHYGADYEFTHRAKENGFQPFVCFQANVFNQQNDGGFNDLKLITNLNDYSKVFFSRKSKRNILYRVIYLSRTTSLLNTIRGIAVISYELVSNFFKVLNGGK
jgi:GT2 family glycosyltransferase